MFGTSTAATSLVRNSTAADSYPVLTLGPDGAPTVAWRRTVGSTQSIRIARTTTGTSWAHQAVATGPTDARLSQLDVVVSTAGTFTAWTQSRFSAHTVQVADNLTGSWRVQQPPTQFTNGEGAWNPVLVASGVKVAVGYSTGDEYPSDGTIVAKRTTTSGTWTTQPTGITASSIDSTAVVGLAVTGSALTVVGAVGNTIYASSGSTF